MQAPILLAGVIALAFLISIPCGYIREAYPKFSLMWFLMVHLPIPLVIIIRVSAGFDWHVVPFTLGSAVAGQIVGGMVRRSRKNER